MINYLILSFAFITSAVFLSGHKEPVHPAFSVKAEAEESVYKFEPANTMVQILCGVMAIHVLFATGMK